MKTYYKLYLFYENELVGNYPTTIDNWETLYETYSKQVILNGYKANINYKLQIKVLKDFMEVIAKQKRNCEKIKASDYIMFLSCFFALLKYNEIDSSDYIFLKIKSTKATHNLNRKFNKKKVVA
tara:strand:+ start:5028 stop:5399 length:372 start_codon:yes stop_codon:yes gene_type:complete